MKFPDLVTPIYERKEREIRSFPCHANRASQIGAACERQLVYQRTHWSEAKLPDVHLKILLDQGEIHEGAVLEDLRKSGFQVLEQQRSLEWKELEITGHVDAVVIHEGVALPLDVKSSHPYIFDQIARDGPGVYEWVNVAPTFQSKPWLKKYMAQITLYALMKNVDRGILLFKNKGNGALAQVNCEVDFSYGEELLKRAERINMHVKQGTLPERIPFDEDECLRCPFFSICLPHMEGKDPIAFLDDAVVLDLLTRREQLRDGAKEYDGVDSKLKSWAKAREETRISIGDWLVSKKSSEKMTRVSIERLNVLKGST